MSIKLVGLAATAAALVVAGPAGADSFTAFTNPSTIANGCSGQQGQANSATPLSAFVSCGGAGYSSTGSASSAPGAVHAAAQALGFTHQQAEADFTGTVTFGVPSQGFGDTPVQFVMPLDGFFTRTIGPITPDDYLGVSASTEVIAQMAVDGGPLFSFDKSILKDQTGDHDNSSASSLGVLSGNPNSDVFNLLLLSPVFQLQLNQAHHFTFRLIVGAGSFGVNEGADADFSHTFGFKPGFTPFILAPGVTANAGDYIVNNVVVNPNPPGPGVPEPASWALLILGFGAAGATLRAGRPARA